MIKDINTYINMVIHSPVDKYEWLINIVRSSEKIGFPKKQVRIIAHHELLYLFDIFFFSLATRDLVCKLGISDM